MHGVPYHECACLHSCNLSSLKACSHLHVPRVHGIACKLVYRVLQCYEPSSDYL